MVNLDKENTGVLASDTQWSQRRRKMNSSEVIANARKEILEIKEMVDYLLEVLAQIEIYYDKELEAVYKDGYNAAVETYTKYP